MSGPFPPSIPTPGGGSQTSPDAQLDLRGTPCPINFVRTKLQLTQMGPGALLEVWLDGGEPMEQVPDSLRMEGYTIESAQEAPIVGDQPGHWVLHVRKPL